MKKIIFLLVCAPLLVTSCKKESTPAETANTLSEAILSKIRTLGFSTQNVKKIPEGYLVEGDILLTEKDLETVPSGGPSLRIAQEEQYRTFNLVTVTGPSRIIKVSVPTSSPSGFVNAVDEAISRFNAQNLRLTFQRVSTGQDIEIRLLSGVSYIASAGFPSNNGNPYNRINYNTAYQAYSNGFMATVIAHEIGHCIGFRHTDYMRRSYSCGFGGNEGGGTIGAVLIPGTPSSPDRASWMLACLSSTTNRPFNTNDIIALNYLY